MKCADFVIFFEPAPSLPHMLHPKPGWRRIATNAIALRAVAFTISFVRTRSTRLALTWLLAVVIPLQGMVVGVLTALGPAHFHKQAKAALVLTDFRRWTPSPIREPKLSGFSGHSHASASVQRHYHAFDNAGVVHTDVGLTENASGVDEGLSASTVLASFLALSPGVVSWNPFQAQGTLASRPFWAPMTVVVEPLDRPPKAA